MPVITNLATVQNRHKDSIDASSIVGLAVRANGEERTKIITRLGVAYNAGIPQPTGPPGLLVVAGGNMEHSKTYYYSWCYAASKAYPLVDNTFSINGTIFPRGNPCTTAGGATIPASPSANRSVQVTVANLLTAAGRPDIDTIFIFRTAGYSTVAEAQNAAAAGLMFFKAQLTNNPAVATQVWTDTLAIDGVDQVEMDNYEAPTAQFVKYYDPYWWLFGNHTFYEKVTWVAATGVITLDALAGTWFDGRNAQTFTLSGVITGGFDDAGAFKFLWLSSTTAQATLDGTAFTPQTLPAMGAGDQFITIQGPPTTLYRSKPRNPFAWGWTRVIGTSREALQFALKVGGGIGTAINTAPNEPILKLDTEFPAKCYGYNLQLADNFDTFKQTQRIVSDVFSVTSHFSQFVATTKDGQNVLWGIDYKNFAILQSNGISQYPISGPIPKILRLLTQDRQKQFLAHGLYDPFTELNCIWVSQVDSPSLVDFLIYQHAPTGFWGFSDEHDLLCSGSITDPDTGKVNSFGGTETGLFGQIFTKNKFSNWLPVTGAFTGVITSATINTITTGSSFNLVDPGIIGNWVLITDLNDGSEQWCRISAVALHTLTIDKVIRYPIGTPFINPTGYQAVITNDFDIFIPGVNFKFYIGMIECKALKYFDFGMPITDKALLELWMSQRDVHLKTFVRFYREYAGLPEMQFLPESQNYDTGQFPLSEVHFNKDDIYSQLVKYFGLEIINRGYQQWQLKTLILKPRITP